MSLKRHLQRLRFIDALIRKKATGNQKALAGKLHLSKSGLNKLLNEMKEMGFPLKYDHKRQTYYYECEGHMVETLFEEETSKEDLKKITGGLFVSTYMPPNNSSQISEVF